MKRFLPKKILLCILVLPILVLSFFLGINIVSAQTINDAVPKPKVPCDQTGNPEFNSLRPYQASPCGDTNYALYCGSKINIVEQKDKTVRGWVEDTPVSWDVNKDYYIDLSDIQFPILGNTELTKNSSNPTDTIDDATKVNEYVSWYLNGTTNRAENGSNDPSKIVNYSGPINKLLPQAIAEADRIASIASASAQATYTPAEDDTTIPAPTTEPQTHNQIVVCTQGGKPTECYKGDGSAAQGKLYRLKDWASGSLSPITTFFNWLGTNVWNNRYPPLPWQFKEQILYEKAYNEWRGQTCAILPIVNRLVCSDLPLVSNRNDFADLFPYIPLASTPDKLGKIPIFTVTIQPSNGTVLDTSDWKKLAAPSLYYPHTQEVKDLSELLNKTFVPNNLSTSDIPSASTEDNSKCRTINVRSNPGDNLFPIKQPGDVGVHVNFHVSSIDNCSHDEDEQGRPISHCHGEVQIGIHTDPLKVPYAAEIWKSTVAGNASTFRRIYPKVEAGAPVTCVADIPSVTNAVYTPVEGTNKITVEGPLGSPDQSVMDPQSAQIFFPHFGSVYDYFLKGIQTALRPKGYADPSPISGKYCAPTVPTDCEAANVPDSVIPAKYLGAFKSNFINQANIWTTGSGCEGSTYNLADECYNYVVDQAQKAKINPAFALTIWLNESDASNYCFGGPTTQDFGIGGQPDLYQNLVKQLEVFLKQPAAFKSCASTPGWIEPMEAFLSRFRSSAGTCTPSDPEGIKYYNDIRSYTWPLLTGDKCLKNGKFAIKWPDDMSCP